MNQKKQIIFFKKMTNNIPVTINSAVKRSLPR